MSNSIEIIEALNHAENSKVTKAISIKQPWASLIAHGIKDIENRTWPTKYRGTILIHVSSKSQFSVQLTDEQTKLAIPLLKTAIDGEMPFGAIIGKVDIVDCVINHGSIWAEKTPSCSPHHPKGLPSVIGKGRKDAIYNWVLANPVLFTNPILNVKGKLSFWHVDDIVAKTLESIDCQPIQIQPNLWDLAPTREEVEHGSGNEI
ncbi:ASCH domain-containing protein [Sphingobacterium hungaricum]|uniref:RNA-binding protein n=1 Tax=Sphingobacterium hungaricum TaxID=2082723 RepID=A0A928UVX7_9SPHI|nr:ASCH domain-containing protein [Sphingobacterium hungaricum]MBE8712506.1 RNA-binding protein [Sphingobacterium hungaricum]